MDIKIKKQTMDINIDVLEVGDNAIYDFGDGGEIAVPMYKIDTESLKNVVNTLEKEEAAGLKSGLVVFGKVKTPLTIDRKIDKIGVLCF